MPVKLLVEANNLLSAITGGYCDFAGLKERARRGYGGEFSDHVLAYDELGFHLQDRSARVQLDGIDFDGMNTLDVGCGTGALVYAAAELGARSVVCGDICCLMLRLPAAK